MAFFIVTIIKKNISEEKHVVDKPTQSYICGVTTKIGNTDTIEYFTVAKSLTIHVLAFVRNV